MAKGVAAIYVRVSTDEQEEGTSLETQEAACRELAVGLGYKEIEIWRETESGGKPFIERTQGADLWAAITDGRPGCGCIDCKITALVCYDPDRFTRTQVDLATLARLPSHGVTVHFVYGDAPGSSVVDLLRGIRVLVAQTERQLIVERTGRGIRAIWERGELGNGRTPFGIGWDVDARRWYAIEDEAAIVRQIFELYCAMTGTATVAAWLNDRDVPPPAAKNPRLRNSKSKSAVARWHPSQVRLVLDNPRYRGVCPALGGKVIVAAPGVDVSDYPDAKIVWRDDYPVIIDADLWQRAQRVRSNRRATTRKFQTEAEAGLFQGRIYCGTCGLRYRIKRGKRRRVIYMCKGRDKHELRRLRLEERCSQRTSLRTDLLRDVVLNKLLTLLSRRDAFVAAVRDQLRTVDARIEDSERRLRPALNAREDYERRLGRIARLYEDGLLSDAEYERKRDELRALIKGRRDRARAQEEELADLEQLRARRADIQCFLDVEDPSGAQANLLTALGVDTASLEAGPEHLVTETMRRLIAATDLRITVRPDGTLELSGSFPGHPGAWAITGSDETGKPMVAPVGLARAIGSEDGA